MAEAEPIFLTTNETAPRGRMSRWWLGGPLLVVGLVVSGMLGWEAWKDYQFEKERTETPPHVVEDLELKLLWIPAGTFVMGTDDEAEWLKSFKEKYNEVKPSGWKEWKVKQVEMNEKPATRVTLTKGFYLGETEVTQAQWEVVMGSNPSQFIGPNRPVERVRWEDCVLFCQKLTQRERAAGRLGSKQVFRMPTEAEWEYSCRAGSRGDWCCGDDEGKLGDFAWFHANSGAEHQEVGTKQKNAWGLFDMHGNLWEWSDAHGVYPGAHVVDPTAELTRSNRVVRGGSWVHHASFCRCAYRDVIYSKGLRNNLGLRLALSSTP